MHRHLPDRWASSDTLRPSLKIFLIIFSSILFIAILVLLLLPSVIDLTKYKTEIEGLISNTMQREVSIKAIKVSLLNGIGAELKEVRIGKEKGASESGDKGQDFIAIESMRIKVALFPLLQKRIEMTGIVLKGIRFFLKGDGSNKRMVMISKLNLPLASYKGSVIDINSMDASLYKGTLTGDIKIEKSERGFRFEVLHNSDGIETEPLIKDSIGSKVSIAGKLKVDGNLKGIGNKLESLEGSGSLDMGRGKIKGLEIGDLVGNIGQITFKRPVSLSDFDRITGHYTIGGGYLRTEDLEMVGKDIYFKARGSYGLINSKLDFLINGKVIDIPLEIRIEGTSSDPKYHIKSPGMEKKVLEEVGKEAIKRKTGKDVDEVLKGWFKKK